MKLFYAAVLLSLLSPTFASADTSDADIETIYMAMCQPGFSDSMSKEDREEVEKLRPEFLKFLRNPEPTVTALSKSALFQKGSGFEALGPLFVYASTCIAAEAIHDRAQRLGCKDTRGRIYSTVKAVQLCAPLTAALKKIDEESAPKN